MAPCDASPAVGHPRGLTRQARRSARVQRGTVRNQTEATPPRRLTVLPHPLALPAALRPKYRWHDGAPAGGHSSRSVRRTTSRSWCSTQQPFVQRRHRKSRRWPSARSGIEGRTEVRSSAVRAAAWVAGVAWEVSARVLLTQLPTVLMRGSRSSIRLQCAQRWDARTSCRVRNVCFDRSQPRPDISGPTKSSIAEAHRGAAASPK